MLDGDQDLSVMTICLLPCVQAALISEQNGGAAYFQYN